MCVTTNECAGYMCVAGRCEAQGPPTLTSPKDKKVTRVVALPTDVAYLRRGNEPNEVPSVVVLGRDKDVTLLLRFSVAIPESQTLVEAYLLLDRSDEVESDPVPISLHAARIIDPWDARSITWERQPRIDETHSPATFVTGSGRSVIRIDVKDLVLRWPRRDPNDQGLAVVSEATSATGTGFASPRLELYLLATVNSLASAPSNVVPQPSQSASQAPIPNPR